MSSDAAPAPVAIGLLEGPFAGRDAFRQQVRDALACAAAQRWRHLVLCDASFEDWPLGEAAVVESLQAWARVGRQFTMLAVGYDGLVRHHARFVAWRQTWSHLIDCRRCRTDDPLSFPSALWADAWCLQRHDVQWSRGVAGHGPARKVALRETLDDCLLRSSAGFPATTLGL